MKNTIGNAVTFTIFGESHGPVVGGVLDGLAAGLAVDEKKLCAQMQKRRARKDGLTTTRQEQDKVRILSGVWQERTTGTPLAFVIENTNVRSEDYWLGAARPGHADWAAHQKYGGFEDFRGGGHFSGRLTAPLTAAGMICEQILESKGIYVGTHIARIAGVCDRLFSQDEAEILQELRYLDERTDLPVLNEKAAWKMKEAILEAKDDGNSVGGTLETAVLGLSGGVGEPFFDTLEGVLSKLIFAIPGVKGVQFGEGFGFADMSGSEANDELELANGRIRSVTNHNGGINGGVANGMPILLRSCIKPTPSIGKPQNTVDLSTGREVRLEIKGRHDPCILPRAAIVQTAATALGVLDLATQRYGTLWQKEGF